MAIELIDGHAGEPHIDGSDAGIFKAGVCGKKGGILDTANKCACTVNSNTSVTVAEGELIMPTSGRLVRVKNPETLTVTTGSASQKRNDLIVARYAKDSTTEIETVSLIVLRGTPTTGTPTDPATQVGDLKLYRLQLDGLTLKTPVKLANDIMPITTLAETKKIAEATVSWTGHGLITKVCALAHGNGTVEIQAKHVSGFITPSGRFWSTVAFTLPEQYRFSLEADVSATMNSSCSPSFFNNLLWVGKNGAIQLGITKTSTANLAFDSGSYIYTPRTFD